MRKLLVVFLAVVLCFTIGGNFTAAKADTGDETTLAIYSTGGNTYLKCRIYAHNGSLFSSRTVYAGEINLMPAIPGGHVEIELFPDVNYYLGAFNAGNGILSPSPLASESCSMYLEMGKNTLSFIFFPIPVKTAVFDIRTFRGEGTLTFKGESQEKSFCKQDFYPGYVPCFENLRNTEDLAPIYRSQSPANPEYRSALSHSSLIYKYQIANKVYLTSRNIITITFSGDAYVTINGEGRTFAKGETAAFTVGIDYQVWKLAVYFLDDASPAAF